MLVLLTNYLYILRLGINLLLIRRLYKARLKGAFNKEKIYFKEGNKTIIYIKMQDRLYIITSIVSRYKEKALIKNNIIITKD